MFLRNTKAVFPEQGFFSNLLGVVSNYAVLIGMRVSKSATPGNRPANAALTLSALKAALSASGNASAPQPLP